jgi:hypothetical protein
VRDPEGYVNHGAAPTRFVQAGTFSVATCVVVGALLLEASARTHSGAFLVGLVVIVPVALLLSTLTIEFDDERVRWYFTGQLLPGSLSYAEIASCTAVKRIPLGFGYRVGFNKRAWIVSGRSIVSMIQASSGMEYIVGSNRAEAVCAELERRKAAAGLRP